jgi:hypothetical protein
MPRDVYMIKSAFGQRKLEKPGNTPTTVSGTQLVSILNILLSLTIRAVQVSLSSVQIREHLFLNHLAGGEGGRGELV